MCVITQEANEVDFLAEEKISGAALVGKFSSPQRQGHGMDLTVLLTHTAGMAPRTDGGLELS